jgi:peptidyl-prolyl cis-trans isomerase A (cyclophilin A)
MRFVTVTALAVLAAFSANAGESSARKTAVILRTTAGDIRIVLETERAPLTSQNFLHYVDAGRFDGATFYRAVMTDRQGTEGIVQGGLQGNARLAFPPVAHESTVTTGLSHVNAAVSMARGSVGSARGEFFIVVGSQINYDGVPDGGDPGFAVFGKVVSGMPVVRRILRMPTSKDAGSGTMKGQMLLKPVTILSAQRVP